MRLRSVPSPGARSLALGALALAGLALAGAPSPSRAEEEAAEGSPPIYKWVDENGIAHYTTELERVPEALRDRAAPLGTSRAEPEEAPSPEARDAAPERGAGGEESWAVRDRPPERTPDPWAEARDPYAEPPRATEDAPEGEAAPAEPGTTGAEPAPSRAARAERRAELERRIEALRAELAEREATVKELISAPSAKGEPVGFAEDSELRSEARRIARLVEDLAALEAKREELGAAEPAESP